METIKLFVYGTLRRHESNYKLVEETECLAEQAWVYGELFDTNNGYPTAILNEKGKVYGELLEINKNLLPTLDQLEDYIPGRKKNLYKRTETAVYTDARKATALIYVNVEDDHEMSKINDGDWKLHQLICDQPKEVFYFAYGSCMDNERFRLAGVENYFSHLVGAAVLERYSMKYLFRVSDGGRADIIEDGGVTEGLLYSIPYEGVEYLFKREGFYGGWYRPTFVDVSANGQVYKDVLTFHVYNKMAEIAPPDHYSTEILRGAKGRLSEGYYQKLKDELHRLSSL